ncbi:hypothetical protein K466DRAFT_567797 [Polyporus arcularius HHB13444]|uniref:Uncharacterized protein n=1 Tax=Polyporus arcularius HHB13444 TaxID=1314778 RepID=A0A5C3P4G5_9APHY|nr:hypothetical protein K466DRAFT_567797 [Polyporus arcularius HHB13444]
MPHISGNIDEQYRAEDGSDVEDENDEEPEHSGGDGYNEGGYTEEDGHGTDVFQIPEGPSRPSDMSDPSAVDMSSQRARRRASPQPEFSMWMNDIADEELALYKRQRLVERFYSFSGPRRVMSLSDLPGRGVDPLPSTTGSTSHAPADPLMLFRTPPPWSSLPSSRPAKPSSTVAATSTFPSYNTSSFASSGPPPQKRRRVEDVAPADQVRKRTHALSSIRAMISMRQNRATDGQPSAGDRAQSGNVHAKRNPFARASGAQTRKSLDMRPAGPPSPKAVSKLKSASTAKTLTPARDAVRATHTGDMAARGDRVSGSSLTNRQPLSPIKLSKAPDKPLPAGSPHPSGKKLKPITTLKIPDCPISMKPLSAHRPQAPDSAKAKKQTTLPVSQEAVSPKPKPPLSNSKSAAAKPTSGRRVSAPASIPNRSDCGPANITAKGKDTPAKPTSKSGPAKGKTPNGGKGFDWKGWSAGPE